MRLEDIGDWALVEEVARIVHAADPAGKEPFDVYFARLKADDHGAAELGMTKRRQN